MKTRLLRRYRNIQRGVFIPLIGIICVVCFGLLLWKQKSIRTQTSTAHYDFCHLRYLTVQHFYLTNLDPNNSSKIKRLKKQLARFCEIELHANNLGKEARAKTLLYWDYLEPGAVSKYVELNPLSENDTTGQPYQLLYQQLIHPNTKPKQKDIQWFKERYSNDSFYALLLERLGEESVATKDDYQFYQRGEFVGRLGSFVFWIGLAFVPYLIFRFFSRTASPATIPQQRGWYSTWAFSLVIIGLAIGYALSLLYVKYTPQISKLTNLQLGPDYFLQQMTYYFCILIVPMLFVMLFYTPSATVFQKAFRLRLRDIFSIRNWLITFGLLGLCFAVLSLFQWASVLVGFNLFNPYDSLSGARIDLGIAGIIAALISGCIIAPICEEVIYRGFIFGPLTNHLSPWIAGAISSTFFAATHFYSLSGVIWIFICGMFFCWIYMKSGTLWVPILFHSISNLASLWTVWYTYSADFRFWGYLTQ